MVAMSRKVVHSGYLFFRAGIEIPPCLGSSSARTVSLSCPGTTYGRHQRHFSASAGGADAKPLRGLRGLQIELSSKHANRAGGLSPLLKIFDEASANITHIESKLHQYSFGGAHFEIDFEPVEDASLKKIVASIRDLPEVLRVREVQPTEVPWFPTSLKELDSARTTLDGGTALISEDHPGFHDVEYRKRRDWIVENAKTHNFGQPIPTIEYSEQENHTWQLVYDRLEVMHQKYACNEFKHAMAKFQNHGVLTRDRIPQLAEVSEILFSSTGFQIRPVMGLLTARDFLNSLAFRVFWSTQYIRHHSNPYYTPEPDVCHELLGHVPLFANPDFADFSQTIGLASLGATDEQIDELSTLYWFTVEFGVLKVADGSIKAYGAGILSSFGEIEWACSPSPTDECRTSGGLTAYKKYADLANPDIKTLKGSITSRTAFPITTFQPQYFASASLADAKAEVMRFCDKLQKPFFSRYDPFSNQVSVTRSIRRQPSSTTADLQASKQMDYFSGLELIDKTE